LTSLKLKGGLILFNKPTDVTSFKVLSTIKESLKIKRVGHAGTLDKFATGLLLVLTGPYTRLVPYLTNLDKEYLATFQFGTETTTLDPEGEVVQTGPVPTRAEIDIVLDQFRGELLQVPPLYSAVHHQGKRAYELALKGIEADLAPRSICIYKLEIQDYAAPVLTLRIHCSKGTYIRSLARDIGHACGSCAYVTSLQRTSIGPFRLEEAVSPLAFDPQKDLLAAYTFLPLLKNFMALTVLPEVEAKVLKGMLLRPQQLGLQSAVGEKVALFNQAGQLIALLEFRRDPVRGESYRYLAVFDKLND
jgi:tRNA pseudouridine55 synthase